MKPFNSPDGLPAGVYVHTVKEDPVRRGLLFAGTERGTFLSFDDGDHWQPLQLNLPVNSVRDFAIYGNDLIVATHGRSLYALDGILEWNRLYGPAGFYQYQCVIPTHSGAAAVAELLTEIENSSRNAVAKRLGVSFHAVVKHLKSNLV